MQIDRRRFIGAAFAVGGAAIAARTFAQTESAVPAVVHGQAVIAGAAETPRVPLLGEALAALEAHKFAARDKLALVDFALPSSEPRMHVIDVASGRIERSWLVAHGKGSDPSGTGMLHSFSNQPGSNASCNGAFMTADRYHGQHGASQRLIGLDPSNSLALERAIVVHGAEYVDPALIARQGRIGRSQGCFAFDPDEVATVMAMLGEGRMIYAGKA